MRTDRVVTSDLQSKKCQACRRGYCGGARGSCNCSDRWSLREPNSHIPLPVAVRCGNLAPSKNLHKLPAASKPQENVCSTRPLARLNLPNSKKEGTTEMKQTMFHFLVAMWRISCLYTMGGLKTREFASVLHLGTPPPRTCPRPPQLSRHSIRYQKIVLGVCSMHGITTAHEALKAAGSCT